MFIHCFMRVVTEPTHQLLQEKLPRLLGDNMFGKQGLTKGKELVFVPGDFIQAWKNWVAEPTCFSRPTNVGVREFICEHNSLSMDVQAELDNEDTIAFLTVAEWATLSSL